MSGLRATLATSILSVLLFAAGQGSHAPEETSGPGGFPTVGELLRRFQGLVGAPVLPEASERADIGAAGPGGATPTASSEVALPAGATARVSTQSPPAPVATDSPSSYSVRASKQGLHVALARSPRAEPEPALRPLRGTVVVRATTTIRRTPEQNGGDAGRVPAGVVADVVGVTLDGRWYRIAGASRRYLATDAVRPRSVEAEGGVIDVDALRAGIDRIELSVRRARFEQSIDEAAVLRAQLGRIRGWSDLAEPAVRLEIADATARLALGEIAAAREALSRSLDQSPELTLDPRSTSPKLVRLLESVRSARQGRSS